MALITTNLKVQFEMDNAVVSPTLWTDEVAGIELTQVGSMTEPALRTGVDGTPTGASYFAFDGSVDGLGTASLAGQDIPDGAEPRTMYVVVRYPTGSSAGNFHGVVYGTNTTRQAFGVVLSNTEKLLTDFWSASFATVDNYNDATWHVVSVTFDGSGVVGYVDNAGVISGTPATLNTVLSKLYINYKLSDNTGALMDCAAVLIYAGEHTGPQLTEMYNYLNAKYITPGAAGDEVGGATLSSGTPTVTGGGLGQTHALAGASLTSGVPTISGGAVGQTHALSGASLASGVPSITGGDLGAVSAVGGTTLSSGTPTISGGDVGQNHALPGASLSSGAPTVAGGGLGQTHALPGAVVASGAPAITGGGLGQTHALPGASLAAGVPTLSGGALNATSSVGGTTVSTGTPSIVGGVLGQNHALPGATVSTGEPSITGGALNAVSSVGGATISTGTPTIAGGAVGQIHLIAGTDLTGGTPAVSGGAVGQLHLVAGTDLQAGVPTITGGVLSDSDNDFALIRLSAIWEEPRLSATWEEPRLSATWEEPRLSATWRQ